MAPSRLARPDALNWGQLRRLFVKCAPGPPPVQRARIDGAPGLPSDSGKTASVHESNEMTKLGALSRYAAAASAERLGMRG
jgi:hypothetical protein